MDKTYIEILKEILPDAIQEKRLVHSEYGNHETKYVLEPKFTYKDWYICIPCMFARKKGQPALHFNYDKKRFIEILNMIKNG